MRVIPLTAADSAALADRLATHESMRSLPRAELEWLVNHGQFRHYDAGEVMLTPVQPAQEMIVQFSGRIVVYFGHGAGRRHAAESRAGSVTGLLPFSRLKRPPADVLVEEASELLAIHRDQFRELIRECPVLTESLVHNMLDRTRRFAAADWQDEKVMALGRLAAGLAHELNNPATAVASGAKRLSRGLQEVGAAAHRFGIAGVPDEQRARVAEIVERCQRDDRTVTLSPMERADLEERLGEWLEAHGVDDELAPTLAEGGVGLETLDQLAGILAGDALAAALHWIGSASAATIVAGDVDRAARRIHDLVSAVRGFTYMDRAAVREPTDVGRGLSDTVEVLRAEANTKRAALTLEIGAGLPKVSAVAPDLNQVWSNLLENALDAVDPGGEVLVRAAAEDGGVVVQFVDNGHGIPEDIQPRIFDPFFTTKAVGEGPGLGLDIVRRIVRNHNGDVEFTSRPGRTEFRVRIPVEAPPGGRP